MDKQKLLEQLEQLKEKKKQLDVIEQFQDTQQHAYKIFLDYLINVRGHNKMYGDSKKKFLDEQLSNSGED